MNRYEELKILTLHTRPFSPSFDSRRFSELEIYSHQGTANTGKDILNLMTKNVTLRQVIFSTGQVGRWVDTQAIVCANLNVYIIENIVLLQK